MGTGPTTERGEFSLATGLFPVGPQAPVGLLGMGRALMNVSANKGLSSRKPF